MKDDTIVALATPPGIGGVGIVRVSGPNTLKIARKLLKIKPKNRYAHYLPFYNLENQMLDQGIALFFKGPNSLTGEDVLEIQAHGGPVILDALMEVILSLGARVANPGEFLQRAFLNNKIDLVQAEAVADLINASSKQAAISALSSYQGKFSKEIENLVEKIIMLRTYVEAAIDFSEEEIDFLSDEKVFKNLEEILKTIDTIKQEVKQGILLREGMTVVIAGKPNVGKSSLLNSLSGRESAIVTSIAGTTRDVLKEYIHIDGMPLHIIDTAGLRSSEDIIEKEGIKRTWHEIKKADKVIYMMDVAEEKDSDPRKLWPDYFDHTDNKKAFVIVKNKIDLINTEPSIKEKKDYTEIHISVKEEKGIDLLKKYLKDYMGYNTQTEGKFIARRRHIDAVNRAHNDLLSAKKQLQEKNGELLAEDLKQAQKALSEITGEFSSDDLLNKIFSSFCIGK